MPWTEAARQASLEARRANAKSKSPAVSPDNADAARALAQGGAKSAPVPVHSGAAGRSDMAGGLGKTVIIQHHPDYGEYRVPSGAKGKASGYFTNDKSDAEATARSIHGQNVNIIHRSKRYNTE